MHKTEQGPMSSINARNIMVAVMRILLVSVLSARRQEWERIGQRRAGLKNAGMDVLHTEACQ